MSQILDSDHKPYTGVTINPVALAFICVVAFVIGFAYSYYFVDCELSYKNEIIITTNE